mgnify:FL=1|jgi:2-keto-3-deoxy-L-rhamnonate aldolase RhmA
MLNLFYITNSPEIAKIADDAGVNRIFVDMEYIGKEARQGGMDTVKNHHTIQDIRNIKQVLHQAHLLVRVNPIHERLDDYPDTEEEIDLVIGAGADIIMLPMYRTVADVNRFIKAVDGRAKTMLLCETSEAVQNMQEIVKLKGIDEIHIGLNDLHLALHKKFMFELLADGTVDKITATIKDSGIPYGFGGIARIGYGVLPAERIIAEHYRLGSQMAILSRSFCNVENMTDLIGIKKLFNEEILKIRKAEERFMQYTPELFSANHNEVIRLTNQIVQSIH